MVSCIVLGRTVYMVILDPFKPTGITSSYNVSIGPVHTFKRLLGCSFHFFSNQIGYSVSKQWRP